VHVSAAVPSDVTLLSNRNNNEQLFINLATVPADEYILSRLRKAVPLATSLNSLKYETLFLHRKK
jgi:hypothetical protein